MLSKKVYIIYKRVDAMSAIFQGKKKYPKISNGSSVEK